MEGPTESAIEPVPDTRSANRSPPMVRLSPLAIGFTVRRARICVAGLAGSPESRSSAKFAGPVIFTLMLAKPTAFAVTGSGNEARCFAASRMVCDAPDAIATGPSAAASMR